MHDPRHCTAHADRGSRPCRHFPMRGTTVCRSHGGAAVQVRAKAAGRLAMADAMATSPRRHPGEILLDAVHALDVLEQQTRLRLGAEATPDQVAEWVSGVRSAAALAKTAVDAQLADRMVALEEAKGALLAEGLRDLFGALGLQGRELQRANRLTVHMLRALAEGRVPQLSLVRDVAERPALEGSVVP